MYMEYQIHKQLLILLLPAQLRKQAIRSSQKQYLLKRTKASFMNHPRLRRRVLFRSIAKKMKAELNSKNQQLQNLVDQLLSKQANKYTSFAQLFEDVKNGKISVDPTTVAQAQKDIAEDGYWGAEQTSDRLVSMAQALSGGDTEKADKMIAAIKKGYEQATNAWGGKLPDICQRTIDLATKKLESWRDGLSSSEVEE